MISKVLIMALAILVIAQAGDQVVVLDDSNYTTFIQANPYVFVKFYAPWCGHCKSMIPEYQKLAKESDGKPYVIAKVDATVATQTGKANGVQGFPSLKLIVNGVAIDYDKGRNSKDIKQFIQAAIQAKVSAITAEEVQTKISNGEKFVVFQGASDDQLKNLLLADMIDSSVQYYNLGQGSFKVTIYLKDNKSHEYKGQINPSELKQWSVAVSMPILVPLDGRQQTQFIFNNPNPLPSFLLLKNDQTSNELLNSLQEICSARKTQFRCSTLDKTSKLYNGGSKFLQAQQNEQLLAYIGQSMKQAYKFPDLSEFSNQNINKFLDSIKSGQTKSFLKSEEEEGQKKQGQNQEKAAPKIEYVNVLKLTAETYNQTLKDNKIVFVEYYTPGCGHCIRLAPEYENLATKVKNDGLPYIIAAVDLQAQIQISEWVNVRGYPTLRIYINGNELQYTGERVSGQILKFIQKTSQSKLIKAASVEQVAKPAVVVYGISQDSQLHLLPSIFSALPIYSIEASQFSIDVHHKQVHHYTGQAKLRTVLQYIEKITDEIVPGIIVAAPSKKVINAIQNRIPILTIINRDATGQAVFHLLQKYCADKTGYICGYAKPQDAEYEPFNNWVEDPEPTTSTLIYIQTQKFEKYLYKGDLSTLTEADIDQFLADIKQGKIAIHKSAGQAQPEEDHVIEGQYKKPEGAQATQQVKETEQTKETDQSKAQQQQL